MPTAGGSPDTPPTDLIAVFTVIVIAILLSGYLIYSSQEQQITDQVTGDLTAISKLKADQIASWRQDRLYDARVISSSPYFTQGAEDYLTTGSDESRQGILRRFQEKNVSSQYHNLLLVDPQGEIKISLDSSAGSIAPVVKSGVVESLARGNSTLTDLYRNPGTGTIQLTVIAPLILQNGTRKIPIGAVLLTVDPDSYLYPYVQTWPVPSRTAESLLVERDGDTVRFLNNLRHADNTALNLTIPLTSTEVPAVMAVNGMTGPFIGRDYRNNEVISVIEPVKDSPWYLVTKVDTAEAFAAWKVRSGLIIGLIIGTLIVAIIVVGLIWQRRQKYFYRNLYAAEVARRLEEEKNRERLEVLTKLSRMDTAKEPELADFVLDAAGRLTGSPYAFIGVMSADEKVLEITAWSRSAARDCAVSSHPVHLPVDKAGIWADAVRKRRPVLVNDYATYPDKQGVPAGHIPIRRFISLPVLDGGRIVMVSAVANRESDYTQVDIDHLTLLMQGVWTQIQRRQADMELHRKTMDLEAACAEITASEEELRTSYEDLAHSQLALSESERKYRNLYRYAQVGLFETSLSDATVIACNQQYAELAGFGSVEDAIGKDVLGLYANPDDRGEVKRILKEQGHIDDYVTKFRNRSTGRVFWARFSARFNEQKNAAEGSIIDITSLKETEDALRERERQSRRILETMQDAYIRTDSQGIITMANPSAARMYRYPDPQAMIGLPVVSLFREKNYSDEILRNMDSSGIVSDYPGMGRRSDGSLFWFSINLRVIRDGSGKIIASEGFVRDITDRKMAEEALRESSRRLLEAQEMAHLGFWSWDVRTGNVEWSDEVFRIFGLDPVTFTPTIESVLAFSPWPEEQHRDKELIRRAAESRETGTYEQRFYRPDRSIGHYYSTFQGRYDEMGSLISIVGTVLDITERKEAEVALKESEEKYRFLFTQMSEGCALHEMIYDKNDIPEDYRIIDVNPAFEKILGIRRGDVVGKTSREAYGTTTPPYLESYAEVVETGKPARFETYFAPKGKYFAISAYQTRTDRFATVFEDITERKLAEDALRESQAKLSAALSSMTDAVSISDTQGTFIDFNDAFATFYRFRNKDECKKTLAEYTDILEVFLADGTPASIDLWAASRAMKGETATNVEYHLRRKDTGECWVGSFSFGPIRDLNGMIIGAVVSRRDISEHKQAEIQREALIREFEKKNAALERFSYTVSHELRSPLITIRGYAGRIEEDLQTGDPLSIRKDLSRIIQATDTMQVLLADLRELSQAGKIIFPPRPVSFRIILDEALELLSGSLAERNVRIIISPDLPWIHVDPSRIREALVNILENSIKFSGDREDPVIRIGVEFTGESPVFFIQDNGIGINPKYLGRIFNLFERLDPSQFGAGIGLPIARRIIEAHGGRIWAESEGEGMGTTIRFTLPPVQHQCTDNNNNGKI